MEQELFSNYFIPHGHCYLWKPDLVGLHILSDSLIAIAYFSIPLELIYIVKKRKDVPFDWVFMLFGSFIVCCGITHIMEIWTLWHPNYWLSGFVKAITAMVSLCTAAVIVDLIPKVLAIPSPDQLKIANLALQNEIAERTQAQEALSQLTLELEERVQQRTAELRHSEAQLRTQTKQLETTLQELQRTQTQLVQTEKMSSLGQMVAGVAHEINNPINFIYANIAPAFGYFKDLLDLLKTYEHYYPNPMPEIQEKREIIELDFLLEDLSNIFHSLKNGAERIKEIVKSLRTFSRLDEADMKEVNIHEGIDSTLMILQHRLKEQPNRAAIKVIKEYGNLPLVECYAGQLNQVFMNILSNAIDALEMIVNECQYPSCNLPYIIPTIRISSLLVDGNVQIKISDNGVGIPPDVINKIYDPFYTTKPIGYGTGLGLAISYQIITKHQGTLQCLSELGKGTEFMIEIPLNLKTYKLANCYDKILV